eukprot:1158797-Pelagomonas_calceolata.AAC.3
MLYGPEPEYEEMPRVAELSRSSTPPEAQRCRQLAHMLPWSPSTLQGLLIEPQRALHQSSLPPIPFFCVTLPAMKSWMLISGSRCLASDSFEDEFTAKQTLQPLPTGATTHNSGQLHEDAPAVNSRGGVAWRKLLSASKWAEEEEEHAGALTPAQLLSASKWDEEEKGKARALALAPAQLLTAVWQSHMNART